MSFCYSNITAKELKLAARKLLWLCLGCEERIRAGTREEGGGVKDGNRRGKQNFPAEALRLQPLRRDDSALVRALSY